MDMAGINNITQIIGQSGPIEIIGAFIIGFIGAISYLFVVYIGFAGGKNLDDCRTILEAFLKKSKIKFLSKYFNISWIITTLMVLCYSILGGSMALIFQLTYNGVFAPIPALIMGITWPILVSSYLAGKLSGGDNGNPSKFAGFDEPNYMIQERNNIYNSFKQQYQHKSLIQNSEKEKIKKEKIKKEK